MFFLEKNSDHMILETLYKLKGRLTFLRKMLKVRLSRSRSEAVQLRHSHQAALQGSDKADVRLRVPIHEAARTIGIPWAMQMRAISAEEPSRLVQTLTGAILGCGGWVLSRGANDTGTVNMLFEFERQACVDIYSVMIAAGVELNQNGHLRITELCQCTRSHPQDCGTEIASIDLEIQTFPAEIPHGACAIPVR
jgi:hypothetical protein